MYFLIDSFGAIDLQLKGCQFEQRSRKFFKIKMLRRREGNRSDISKQNEKGPELFLAFRRYCWLSQKQLNNYLWSKCLLTKCVENVPFHLQVFGT